MRLPSTILNWLLYRIADVMLSRSPDQVIGGHDDPYLLRWYLIPRNPFFNIYAHRFLRSDDDRALHDHPWFWCSVLLAGSYLEHTTDRAGLPRATRWDAGSLRFGSPWRAHRVELPIRNGQPRPVNTLFLTGPRIRSWGFYCPQGWRHWRKFTSPEDSGSIGPGCD